MTTLTYHDIAVTRTARIACLGDPATAREAWIVLHGYGQLASDFLVPFAAVALPGRVILAPEGLSRFYVRSRGGGMIGASWMTSEARESEIADYVTYLDEVVAQVLGAEARASLTLLGFSQGTATATHWVERGVVAPHRLILWGGAPAADLDMETFQDRLQGCRVHLVHGSDDRLFGNEAASEAATRLTVAGIEARIWQMDGGHEISAPLLRELAESSD